MEFSKQRRDNWAQTVYSTNNVHVRLLDLYK